MNQLKKYLPFLLVFVIAFSNYSCQKVKELFEVTVNLDQSFEVEIKPLLGGVPIPANFPVSFDTVYKYNLDSIIKEETANTYSASNIKSVKFDSAQLVLEASAIPESTLKQISLLKISATSGGLPSFESEVSGDLQFQKVGNKVILNMPVDSNKELVQYFNYPEIKYTITVVFKEPVIVDTKVNAGVALKYLVVVR